MESRARILAGTAVLALIGAVLAGAALGLLGALSGAGPASDLAPDAYLARVVAFTLLQATLSTALSLAFAVPLARALARRPRFPGRALLVRLLALPLALPAIVAVLGLVEVWGGRGWANALLGAAGLAPLPSIYGLSGILVAHVFFNMPLAARLLLGALERIPAEHWRLAGQLGLPPGTVFRLIELPAIRRSAPGVAGLVFMLCVASFTVVLTLGGGPDATTIEVAIYQALRFDFDPGRAVALAAAQLALTAFVLALASRLDAPLKEEAGLGRAALRYDGRMPFAILSDACTIAAAIAYVALPLAAIVVSGLAADLTRLLGEPVVRRAVLTSLALGTAAAALSVVWTAALVGARRASSRRSLARACDAALSLVLAVPPIVIGAGWFVLLNPVADVFALAPVMVVVVNAIMALPFAARALEPAIDSVGQRTGRLAASLGIGGLAWLRLIGWPLLRRPLALAFGFSMALSLGDLGVIALFGSDAVVTLPYLLLQRTGSYRTADAAGLALILGALALGVLALAEVRRGGAAGQPRIRLP